MNKKPIIITIFNNKGGVRKTTTTVALACSLASQDYCVGMIDLDAQGHIESFWPSDEPRQDIVTIIKKLKSIQTFIQKSDFRKVEDNLYLLPNDKDLTEGLFYSLFPNETQNKERYLVIPSLLSQLEGFDYILIETPPNIENRSIGAMLSADLLLIPTELENWSVGNINNVVETVNNLKNLFPKHEPPKIVTVYTRVGATKKALNNIYTLFAQKNNIPNLGSTQESSEYQWAVGPPYYSSKKCKMDYDKISKQIIKLCKNKAN